MKTLLWISLMLVAACTVEDDPALPIPLDGEPRAAADEAVATTCDPDFGRVYVFDVLQLVPPEQGLDLDGDGEPDNALGALHELANEAIQDAIDVGYANVLIEVAPWMETRDDAPAELGIALFHGIDTDDDPSNNLDGSGTFAVAKEQFDVSCTPTSSFENVSFEDGRFAAATDDWTLFLRFFGGVEFTNLRVEGEVAPDMAEISGTAGAIWTLCSMSTAPFPGSYPGSWLDLLTNDSLLMPDIDRDGDGLEQVIGNGDAVIGCIDGDGTAIPGPFCPCDPRIADGYSAAIYAHGVPARITDIVETAP